MTPHLKVLRGNAAHEKPSKLENEILPQIAANVPEPPPFLHRYAREEWGRVATECYRLHLLTTLDVQLLAGYCEAYARWRSALEKLAKMAKDDPETDGLLAERFDKNGNTFHIRNPLLAVINQSAIEMLRFAGEFGLTPAARARLAAGIPIDKTPGKFDGLLAV